MVTVGAALTVRHQRGAMVNCRGYINGWVGGEEVGRGDVKLQHLDRPGFVSICITFESKRELAIQHLHHGPVLDTRVVGQAKYAPEHDVFVQNVVIPSRSIGDSANLLAALQGIPPAGIQLVVFVLCHPQVMLRKLCTLRLNALPVSQKQLCCWWSDLVADWSARDSVELPSILDLEDAVVVDIGVEMGGGGYWRLPHLVIVALRIRTLVHDGW